MSVTRVERNPAAAGFFFGRLPSAGRPAQFDDSSVLRSEAIASVPRP
jgi:hypothetical protein